MGGSGEMMRSLKLQGRPWSFSDIACSHGQKKGKDWMQRCTAETCFLTHIPAKLRHWRRKAPFGD